MPKSTPYLLLVLVLALGGCRSHSKPEPEAPLKKEATPEEIRAAALKNWQDLQAKFGNGWFERTECLRLESGSVLFAKGAHQFQGKSIDPVIDPRDIDVKGPFFFASPAIGTIIYGTKEESSFKVKRRSEDMYEAKECRVEGFGDSYPKPYPWMQYAEKGINQPEP